MNLSFYIARRLALNEKKIFSGFIIRIAILAVTLSIAVMIIGSAITRGYQEVIQDKFYDCWGHIHITPFLSDPSNLNNEETIEYDSTLVTQLHTVAGIQSVDAYTIQSAILKTKQDIEGLLLKGITKNGNNSINRNYLIDGTAIDFKDSSYSTDLLISKTTAEKLSLSTGDYAILYFLVKDESQPKARKTRISGIYKTGLEDYDNLFAVCDARLINHITKRSKGSIHGYEIYVSRKADKKRIEKTLYDQYVKAPLQTYLIDKRFENVFSWLGMMKMNERIIILIMLIIAIINMVTALLILVLERTQMVGILKSLGMKNFQIQQVFIFSSMYILSLGLLAGTVLGTGLCMLQQRFGFLHLDEGIYYVKTVPVFLDPLIILLINLIAFIICTLLLLIPSLIVKKISPTKALRFN
jgi:lipoprotein-releasing system permease protein